MAGISLTSPGTYTYPRQDNGRRTRPRLPPMPERIGWRLGNDLQAVLAAPFHHPRALCWRCAGLTVSLYATFRSVWHAQRRAVNAATNLRIQLCDFTIRQGHSFSDTEGDKDGCGRWPPRGAMKARAYFPATGSRLTMLAFARRYGPAPGGSGTIGSGSSGILADGPRFSAAVDGRMPPAAPNLPLLWVHDRRGREHLRGVFARVRCRTALYAGAVPIS